jgi:hypothetical protein
MKGSLNFEADEAETDENEKAGKALGSGPSQ